jgi:hypothetical protein
MYKLLTFTLFILYSTLVWAQNGPGGIGNTNGSSELKLWLKADAGPNVTTDGMGVNLWSDQSGAGNDLSSTGTATPIYRASGTNGMPYLEFDGIDDYLDFTTASPDFSNTESTVFVVADGDRTGAYFSIAQYSIVNEMTVLNNTAYHHSSSGNFRNLGHQCLDSLDVSQTAIVSTVFGETTTDLNLFVNGLESTLLYGVASNPVNYTVQDRVVRVGKRVAEFFQGNIYEVIIYNRKLTNNERIDVEDYLRCKYNIVENGCGDLTTISCSQIMNTVNVESNSIRLYPNPTTSTLFIETPAEKRIEALRIFSLTGQLLKEEYQRFDQIDVQDLPAGSYIISIVFENGKRENKVFMKQ